MRPLTREMLHVVRAVQAFEALSFQEACLDVARDDYRSRTRRYYLATLPEDVIDGAGLDRNDDDLTRILAFPVTPEILRCRHDLLAAVMLETYDGGTVAALTGRLTGTQYVQTARGRVLFATIAPEDGGAATAIPVDTMLPDTVSALGLGAPQMISVTVRDEGRPGMRTVCANPREAGDAAAARVEGVVARHLATAERSRIEIDVTVRRTADGSAA